MKNFFYLERLLIPFEKWNSLDCPSEVKTIAFKEHEQGVPTGIGFDKEKYGWFILQSCGQGPVLIWSENNKNLN